MVGRKTQAAQARPAPGWSATRVRHRHRGQALNAYLDASALVKIVIEEAGSDEVRRLVAASMITGASAIAVVECRSALARLRREGILGANVARERNRALDRFWEDVYSIGVDDAVLRDASALVARHPLGALDAVHLASATGWMGAEAAACTFACWDGRLWDAATAAGFEMVPPRRP